MGQAMSYDPDKPYGCDNCDDALLFLAEETAAEIAGSTVEQAHEVYAAFTKRCDECFDDPAYGSMDAVREEGLQAAQAVANKYGIDAALIIMIIELLTPVLIEILENCPEPSPERVAKTFRRRFWRRKGKWAAEVGEKMFRQACSDDDCECDEATCNRAARIVVFRARRKNRQQLAAVVRDALAA